MAKKKQISDIRAEIDSIDDEIMKLLMKRSLLSVEVGRIKHAEQKLVFDPTREEAIIGRLESSRQPPMTRSMVEGIFREIFSASRSLQQRQKVAYLGPEGSFSHQGAFSAFSLDGDLMPFKDIESVIQAVASSRVDIGVVPVENSTEGMINQTLDMMASTRLSVIQEFLLPIRNCLLSGIPKERIRKVFSHPQALAQCKGWLTSNLPGAEVIETASTSDAAMAARSHEDGAAVASSMAAELYGLSILAENINDMRENITRFWVIARSALPVAGSAKSSIIVTLDNKPGALYSALGVFARKGINLTKIESRPSKKSPWEYLFFIDFQGNLVDENVKETIDEVSGCTRDLIILGSYPEGRILP
ncbi:MAG: prephenate dehydratase [Desulfobacterota bacterium]|nr:prephenate dehydratase [Thermodesulfobacteriota bacterium]